MMAEYLSKAYGADLHFREGAPEELPTSGVEIDARLVNHSKGVDCLIHAAWKAEAKNATPSALRSIGSAEDAGRVFSLVRPKLAVVYHYLEDQGLADAVRSRYDGRFVVGRDLVVIDIGRETTWHRGPEKR